MNILENMAKAHQNKEISLEEYAFNLANEYSRVCKSNYKLQERIDKAIEYIKRFDFEYLHQCMEHNLVEALENLLEILKGEKDNE